MASNSAEHSAGLVSGTPHAPAQGQAAGSPYVRTVGRIGIAAGAYGALGALFKLVYPPSVPDSRYSYPFDSFGFVVENATLAVQHVAMVALMWGVWRSGLAGRSPLARIGTAGAGIAWLTFAGAKIMAIGARDEVVGSSLASTVDAWSGIAGTSVGAFCLLLGIAVLRARVWTGWTRFLPLAAGAVVFVGILPSVFANSYAGMRVAILVWMVVWTLLGWTLARGNTGKS